MSEFHVIGAGQMRTGTNSLKQALEILFPSDKCYHMLELIQNPEDMERWIELHSKQHFTVSDVTFLSQYKHGVDFPLSAYYKEMLEVSPDAKVILTTRDADSWVKSVRQTTINPDFRDKTPMKSPEEAEKWQKFRNNIFQKAYDLEPEQLYGNDELLKEKFHEFNRKVIETVPQEKLLVYEVKQGWEPLCKFLEVPVPMDKEFPNVNTTESFQQRFKSLLNEVTM